VNGDIVASGSGTEVGLDLNMPSGGWIAARCRNAENVVAHSSPQYVQIEGVPTPVDPTAAAFLDAHLQRTSDWIAAEGHFTKQASHDYLLKTVATARQALLARLRASGTIDTPAPPA
jgi:hypothetical protein